MDQYRLTVTRLVGFRFMSCSLKTDDNEKTSVSSCVRTTPNRARQNVVQSVASFHEQESSAAINLQFERFKARRYKTEFSGPECNRMRAPANR